ncbi:MAG TPA: hypothetical protein VE135_07320 [Pyrinomonadaceae bacterium]|nr:hypothetical protein [Pyrinomonadaceae bacterium]
MFIVTISKLLCGLLLLAMAFPANGHYAAQPKVRKFKGAYFEITYPAGFSPRRSLPSNSFEGEYDSAFFTAADGSIEFYVFSPLWNGKPDDIERDADKEEVVSQTLEQNGAIKTRRVTLKAKDSSYMRSFEDTENTETNTRKVFGIKYRDQSAYNKYRQHYLMFKKSLRRFSD